MKFVIFGRLSFDFYKNIRLAEIDVSRSAFSIQPAALQCCETTGVSTGNRIAMYLIVDRKSLIDFGNFPKCFISFSDLLVTNTRQPEYFYLAEFSLRTSML